MRYIIIEYVRGVILGRNVKWKMRSQPPKRKTKTLFPKFTIREYRKFERAYKQFMLKRGLWDNEFNKEERG